MYCYNNAKNYNTQKTVAGLTEKMGQTENVLKAEKSLTKHQQL